MKTRVISLALAVSLVVSAGAFAVTDFTDTFNNGSQFPAGDLPNTVGNWTLEDATGDYGGENRMGGTSNPQSNGTEFSMSGQAGQYIDYNYAAGGAGGLSGSYVATFDAIFKVRHSNNGTGSGSPILSLALGNGLGVSLNVANDPDDTYHYKLVKFATDSTSAVVFDVMQFAVDATSDHQDFNYQHAVLSLDVTGHTKLDWNGSTVFDQILTGLGSVESRAWFGAGTAVQPVAGNAKNHVWFQTVTLSASSVPEPASLGLIALGGLALLRRRG